MDSRFNDIFNQPENQIFQVVFFPDRIYHARYLNATVSDRYRYNVLEVRSKPGVLVMKGEVYLDGLYLCNVLRIEYRSERLVELAREKGRFVQDRITAVVRLLPDDPRNNAEAVLKLNYCAWIDAFQVELWETLEPPANNRHDFKVSNQMGADGSITRVAALNPVLADLKALGRLELTFREDDTDRPFGDRIETPEVDDNFGRTHQEARSDQPSAFENNVSDLNYLIDFQRGWFTHTSEVPPIRYRNALMEDGDPEGADDNIIEMRWIFQRELGSSLVFFHEVTIPPGKVEGAHQHIGSEELYFITEGSGVAYLRVGDDPATEGFPTVERNIFGIGPRECKELPISKGNVIFTKSGGMHGIRNTGSETLKFVAFLYHSN